MKDRNVQYPNRYQLTKVNGTDDIYDLMPAPGTVTEEGTFINKANLLKDETAALYGLDGEAVPDDVLQAIRGPAALTGKFPVATGASVFPGDVVDIVDGAVQRTTSPADTIITPMAYSGGTVCAARLSSDQVVVLSQQGNAGNLYAMIVNENGTEQLASEYIGIDMEGVSVCRIDENRFAYAFTLPGQIEASIGTISSGSITFMSAFSGGNVASGARTCLLGLSNSRALLLYPIGANLYYVLLQAQDSSVSVLSSGNFAAKSPQDLSGTVISDTPDGATVCVCASSFESNNSVRAFIGAISADGQISWSSEISITTAQYVDKGLGLSCCSDGTYIAVLTRSASGLYVRIFDTAGNVGKAAQISADETGEYINTYQPCITILGGEFVAIYGRDGPCCAVVVSHNGTTATVGTPYTLTSGGAFSIAAAPYSDTALIACAPTGYNSYYCTLAYSNGQLAGLFIDSSHEAVALQAGVDGDTVEVAFSGNLIAGWAQEGQKIQSSGVNGYVPKSGLLCLQPWWFPFAKIATGSYVGTGTYGASNPNTLTCEFPIKLLIIGCQSTAYQAIMIYQQSTCLVLRSTGNSQITVNWENPMVPKWYANDAAIQMNISNYTYSYAYFG